MAFEDSKTLKTFSIVTSSETEKVFKRKEDVLESRKLFWVLEFGTIENSSIVFELSKTVSSI
jgi:hypothetical protein